MTAATAPWRVTPLAAAAAADWVSAALEAEDEPEGVAVAAAEPEDWAGAVVGSATPDGQCQWSPWGWQVEAVTAWSWSSSSWS